MRSYSILYILLAFAIIISCNKAVDDKGEKKKETYLEQAPSNNEQKDSINHVASYLKNAEMQCECAYQGENIKLALTDALTLPADSLKFKRYNDYTGKKGEWDLPTLIEAHFLPEQGNFLGTNFYNDIKKEESLNYIKKFLIELEQSNK